MRAAIIVDGKVENIIEVDALDVLGEGVTLVEANLSTAIGDLYDNGMFSPKPTDAPTDSDIATLKAAKNIQINKWREQANFTSFPFQGKQIACDTLSRSDIDGVANNIALFGAFPDGFPNAWKAIDNTFIPLVDTDAFKAMYAAMTAQGAANFSHAQQLKTALAEAITREDIEAIIW